MKNRRRIIIVILSVSVGSLISFWFIQKKVGTLTRDNYMQLIFNFIFAIAIVVGLAILFSKTNKNDQDKLSK